MTVQTVKPWPPPPDLESLKELFASADIEELIVNEAPLDEYDPEAKHFLDAIEGLETARLTVRHTLPILERIWAKAFMLDATETALRRPALVKLAEQIERFFGPEARPQVRS